MKELLEMMGSPVLRDPMAMGYYLDTLLCLASWFNFSGVYDGSGDLL